jgi:antirestriction protein ArdC
MSEVYKIITDRILAELDKGTVPWQKSWSSNRYFARNFVSGDIYQGTNLFMLNFVERYESPLWMTYKQAQDLGGNVKKGEQSSKVVYFKLLDKDKEGMPLTNSKGLEVKIPMIRYSNVFNFSQVEGVPLPEKFQKFALDETRNPIDAAEEIVKKCGTPVKHGFSGAAYIPNADYIEMPNQASFKTPELYYKTLFHEMTHATAPKLKREITGDKSNPAYAKEELIAELGSCFLMAEAGLENKTPIENSASYIAAWRKRLSDDPKLIVQASSEAQKATNFILGRKVSYEVQNEPTFELSAEPPVSVTPRVARKAPTVKKATAIRRGL